MAKIKVTQIRSAIDRTKDQKLTIKALGLGRTNYHVVLEENAAINGMLKKISHLVKVEKL